MSQTANAQDRLDDAQKGFIQSFFDGRRVSSSLVEHAYKKFKEQYPQVETSRKEVRRLLRLQQRKIEAGRKTGSKRLRRHRSFCRS